MRRHSGFVAILGLSILFAGCSSALVSPSPSQPVPSGPTPSGPTPTSTDTAIYSGFEGAEIVYNGAGYTGTFTRALGDSIFGNFEKISGAKVTLDSFCCGVSKLAGMHDSGNVTWTVVSWSTPSDFAEAEAQDLLLPLDRTVVPLDKLQPGTFDENGYVAYAYSANVAWNTDAFPATGPQPTTIEDVFDTAKFPGRRCLFNYPQFGGTLEAAALASGVRPADLYPLDVDKALAELDKIKSDALFYASGSEGIQAFLTGECKIGIMWNGPTWDAIRDNPGAKIAIAPGHAIWTANVNSIPKGTPNEQAAQALLRFIIEDTAGQQELLRLTSYLAVNLLTPPEIPAEVVPFALAGENLSAAIREDDAWYVRNIDAVLKKFNAWLVTP